MLKVNFAELTRWLEMVPVHIIALQDIIDMDPCVSLFDIALCFDQFGYPELRDCILLNKFCLNVARCPVGNLADEKEKSNFFEKVFYQAVHSDGASVISELIHKIENLQRNVEKARSVEERQKLADVTVASTFALLNRLSTSDQNNILEKLSLSIPSDVDKTFFWCLYFCKKTFIASTLDDAEKYALYQSAEIELQRVSPCFMVCVARGELVRAWKNMSERTSSKSITQHVALNVKKYLDCLSVVDLKYFSEPNCEAVLHRLKQQCNLVLS